MTSEWVTRATLLHRVSKQQDEDSWNEFVHYYNDYIYSVIRRMNVNHHDAEEIRQHVALKIWKAMPDFEYDADRGRFRGWICTVTGNEVKMFMRKKLKTSPSLSDAEQDEIRECLHGVEGSALERLAEKEWAAYITGLAWDVIRKRFDEKTCRAFELISQGASPEKVADALKIAKSSVYVYKKRVQDALLEEIRALNAKLD